MTTEELNAAISAAVNAALEAREQRDAGNGKTVYLSRRATAQRLKKDVSTLWRWARIGFLVPVHQGGRVMYAESDILRVERGESVA